MIWHIAKRQLYDNLNSLRFTIAILLTLVLMITNASIHLREHPKQRQVYNDAVAKSTNVLRSRATNLYQLASQGPGLLYKMPSPLSFCADGSEALLPGYVEGHHRFWSIKNIRSLWRLTYPDTNPNLTNIHPDVIQVDWTFIIGYVLSLITLLFSYDSVSGERERGTLRLILVNSIPRHTLLIGKFLGTFLSINIPLALAVLINLYVISTSSSVQIRPMEWGRLGLLCFIAIFYICIFIALGLLVSASVKESSMSLMILLFIWINFVVFMPRILASIAGNFSPSMSINELRKQQKKIRTELNEDLRKMKQQRSEIWPERKTNLSSTNTMWWGELITKEALQNERLNEEYLAQQIAQVRRTRTITRISPTAILQHLFELFAGTGFERHLQFLENARRYARQYREFVVDMDKSDQKSLHIIGIREGMSETSVNPQAIPKFKDTLNFRWDFNNAAREFLLLLLFLVVLLSGSYLTLVRAEV